MVRNFLISILELLAQYYILWALRELQIITEFCFLVIYMHYIFLHTLKYLADKVQIWEQYEMRANEVFRRERFFYDPKLWNLFYIDL